MSVNCPKCGEHWGSAVHGMCVELREVLRRLSAVEAKLEARKATVVGQQLPPIDWAKEEKSWAEALQPPDPAEKWRECVRRLTCGRWGLSLKEQDQLAAEFARIDREAETRGYNRGYVATFDIAQARDDEREQVIAEAEQALAKYGCLDDRCRIAALRRGKS